MTTTIQFGKSKYHLQNEMGDWCKEQFGLSADNRQWVWAEPNSWEALGNWCMSSAFGTTFFYFKNESDATMFALRWK